MHIMRNHTGEKPFKCKHCAYICRTLYDLNSHQSRKHSEETLKKNFKCGLCLEVFLSSSELNYHTCTAHGERTFSCPECDQSFFYGKILKAHIRETHRKETPFPCPFCEYKAKRKFELKSHISRKHKTSLSTL